MAVADIEAPTADAVSGSAITIPAIAEDGSLYPIEKLEAHRRGIQHLAISVFVFSRDRLLIQRRAMDKYHCGGLWANTCCTHPHWGESPEASAPRRLREELGITGLTLEPLGIIDYRAEVGGGLIENERVHMFRAVADVVELCPNPEEVCDTRWVTLPDLVSEVRATPQAFTPWFRIYIDQWAEMWG
jgi:isopentenyl-diphosphate delta-isomerase